MLRAGLKFLIKDALRGARFSLRQSSAPGAIDLPGRVQLTRLADNLLTSLEETVVSLRYGSDQADDMIRAALADYPRLAGAVLEPDFVSRFAALTYRLARGMLARRGLDTIFASELAYAQAGHRLVERARGRDTDWPAPVFAAEVALALMAAAPIRGVPAEEGRTTVFVTDTNTASALTLGLLLTAWLSKREGLSATECVDSASEIVGAAFERMAAAARTGDPATALAAIFSELAAFVP